MYAPNKSTILINVRKFDANSLMQKHSLHELLSFIFYHLISVCSRE